MTVDVRAGGGVVHRCSDGSVSVALVHRPRYDDWSFPKGKCDGDESYAEAAIREVEEETGFVCTIGPELLPVEYRDRRGRAKRVRYWAMTVVDGAFAPNDEVDEIRWCTVDEARDELTYQRDRAVLDSLVAALDNGDRPVTGRGPTGR